MKQVEAGAFIGRRCDFPFISVFSPADPPPPLPGLPSQVFTLFLKNVASTSRFSRLFACEAVAVQHREI